MTPFWRENLLVLPDHFRRHLDAGHLVAEAKRSSRSRVG